MVEDRVTDGERIAQLLSSELTARERGPLGDLAVVDADPDAEPAPEGRVAYAIAARDERVAEVSLYPDAAVLSLRDAAAATSVAPDAFDPERVVEGIRGDDIVVSAAGDKPQIRIESGAAVKRAVDALVAGLPGDR